VYWRCLVWRCLAHYYMLLVSNYWGRWSWYE